MNTTRLLVTIVAAVMIVSTLAPLGAAATGGTIDDELTVSVDDSNVVTVALNETSVADATVNVTAIEDDESYAGDDPYTTDTDGTVELTAPEEPLNVTVEASYEDKTIDKEAILQPIDDDDGLVIDAEQDGVDAIVTVTDNSSSVEDTVVNASSDDENVSESNETTDKNGTATFSDIAPLENESVTVTFETTVDNETAETTLTLEPGEEDAEPKNFGALVSQFVAENKNETDGPFGLAVAGFVVENNPGNAPENAGPPNNAGPGNDNQGPPADAGPSDSGNASDDRQGPPDNAGPSNDDAESNGNGNGPPTDTGGD